MDTPVTTLSLFFGVQSTFDNYQRTYNSTTSELGTKLVACLRPEAPYMIATNKFSSDADYYAITNLRRNLMDMVCYQSSFSSKETPCPKTNAITRSGSMMIRIPNYFSITGPATFPFEIDAKNLIYTVDEDPNYRYTIVELPV